MPYGFEAIPAKVSISNTTFDRNKENESVAQYCERYNTPNHTLAGTKSAWYSIALHYINGVFFRSWAWLEKAAALHTDEKGHLSFFLYLLREHTHSCASEILASRRTLFPRPATALIALPSGQGEEKRDSIFVYIYHHHHPRFLSPSLSLSSALNSTHRRKSIYSRYLPLRSPLVLRRAAPRKGNLSVPPAKRSQNEFL